MSRRIILMVCIFLSLAACSSHKPAIEKKNATPKDTEDNPILIEEQDKFIEFSLLNEQVRINLNMVPILNDYIESAAFPKEAIKEMEIKRVRSTDKKLYILTFSCNEDLCSYLMLDWSNDNNAAMLLADIASLVQMKPSPDDTKLLLQFERKNSLPLPLAEIIVVDTEKWEQLELENKTNNMDFLEFTWPLTSAKWSNNEHVLISKPTINEPTEEQILEWQETEQAETNILLKIMGVK